MRSREIRPLDYEDPSPLLTPEPAEPTQHHGGDATDQELPLPPPPPDPILYANNNPPSLPDSKVTNILNSLPLICTYNKILHS